MKFEDIGNKKIITFEEEDSDSQKRMVEQQLAFLRNLVVELQK